MGCFSGHLMSAASDQKLFCKLCSPFCCSFDEFVEEKVISLSYSSAILTPPLSYIFLHRLIPWFSILFHWSHCCCYANIELLSVQFSHSVMSDSLWPHELQHARRPCPSPTPRIHPNPCPSSQWCHPTMSSSVIPFSSCPQSFSASGSFPMSQLFASGGQSIGLSASASVLPMNTQDWSPLGWTSWISL